MTHTMSDQDPMTMLFTVAGWTAIAMSMTDRGEAELAARVTGAIPPGASLGDYVSQELTIAEWRFIRDALYSDLGRWQHTMADDMDAELAHNGWVD